MFGAATVFAVAMLASGLRTGVVSAKYGEFRRKDQPVGFWISTTFWALMATIGGWATVT